MNKSYCTAPFRGFQFTHRDNRLCCSAGSWSRSTASEFWNGEYIKEVRSKMINGQEVKDCWKCRDREKQQRWSLRQTYNRFSIIPAKDLPTVMDLDFSNFCNLHCIMCGPNRSSKWAGQVSKVTQAQLDDLCSISGEVRHLTLQGGEPTMMPEFEYYFDYLDKNNILQNVEVECISNMTNINNRFYNQLAKCKSVKIISSVDSFGTANDYIRHPSHFETVERNLIALSEKENVDVSIIMSLQTLSMYNFDKFLEWIYYLKEQFKKNNKGIECSINRVQMPQPLDIQNAPLKLKEKLIADMGKIDPTRHHHQFNTEIASIKDNLIKNHKEGNSDALIKFVENIDSSRNIKITNYIPDFYKYT